MRGVFAPQLRRYASAEAASFPHSLQLSTFARSTPAHLELTQQIQRRASLRTAAVGPALASAVQVRASTVQVRASTAQVRAFGAASSIDAAPMADEQREAFQKELSENALVILGSASMSRQAIMREMGIDFIVQKAGIDEKAIRKDTPEELVVALAKAKAEAILKKMAESPNGAAAQEGKTRLLITSDQVVTYKGCILEKPDSPEQAKEWIQGYSAAPAGTVGALLITNLETGFQAVAVDKTETYFKEIPDDVVEKLVQQGVVFYCAGGLMVEHPLIAPLITRMVGNSDTVMGLPKETTWNLLRKAFYSQE